MVAVHPTVTRHRRRTLLRVVLTLVGGLVPMIAVVGWRLLLGLPDPAERAALG